VPRGIRVGTATLTSRSVPEEQFKVVASLLHRAVQLSIALQNEALSRSLEEFYTLATTGQGETAMAVGQLRKDVRAFARGFPVPGIDINTLEKLEGSEED
jgi:glycine hydroxymethyltransferase